VELIRTLSLDVAAVSMELPVVAPARCELRSVIKFFHAKKIPPIEIHRQLEEVYGEKCIEVKNVRKWCREFSAGRLNFHDKERSGRPSHSYETVWKVAGRSQVESQ